VSDPDLPVPDMESVERLVRSYLDSQSQRLDTTELEARIRRSRTLDHVTSEGRSPNAKRNSIQRGFWPRSRNWVALAASVLLMLGAFLGGRYLSPNLVNAATLLRSVRVVHSSPIDRSYRVHYSPDPRYWDRKKVLEGPSESLLRTRGDRFWSDCAIGSIRLAIGCEQDGSLWVSTSRKSGLRLAKNVSELPPEVGVLCDVNAMTVPKLLDDVLADFTIQAEASSTKPSDASTLIWARLKPGHKHHVISAALLEIDDRRELLVRLVLWTVREGRPNGTVTYTLLSGGDQGEAQYRLESHLDHDAKIETEKRASNDDTTKPKAARQSEPKTLESRPNREISQ